MSCADWENTFVNVIHKYCANVALIALHTIATCHTPALQTADRRVHVRKHANLSVLSVAFHCTALSVQNDLHFWAEPM